mgnify:FL=1
MPHYKYKKIVTEGPYGTTIGHRSSVENEINTLGDIGEYTYIYTESLVNQPDDLIFEEIILDKSELDYLKRNDVYISALEATIQAEIKNKVKFILYI